MRTSLVVRWLRHHLLKSGVWVQSLIRELTSHMPWGQTIQDPRQKQYGNTFNKDFKMVHIKIFFVCFKSVEWCHELMYYSGGVIDPTFWPMEGENRKDIVCLRNTDVNGAQILSFFPASWFCSAPVLWNGMKKAGRKGRLEILSCCCNLENEINWQ